MMVMLRNRDVLNLIGALVMLSASNAVAQQVMSQSSFRSSSTDQDEIIVVAEKLARSHVQFNIDRRTRAVRCKAKSTKIDPVYAELKCEIVRRCAKVEPYSGRNVRQCLERMRGEVAAEYARAKRP